MFRNLERLARQLEGTHSVSVEIESDDEGYFDRQCPKTDCEFFFKVHFEDWKEKAGDKAACPFCDHFAELVEWVPSEQLDHVRSIATDNRR